MTKLVVVPGGSKEKKIPILSATGCLSTPILLTMSEYFDEGMNGSIVCESLRTFYDAEKCARKKYQRQNGLQIPDQPV